MFTQEVALNKVRKWTFGLLLNIPIPTDENSISPFPVILEISIFQLKIVIEVESNKWEKFSQISIKVT